MMKCSYLLLLLFTFFVVAVVARPDTNWFSFKKTFNRNYANQFEDTKRYNLWIRGNNFIETHNKLANKSARTFHVGINTNADLTNDEMNKYRYGFIMPKDIKNKKPQNTKNRFKSTEPLPDSIDWRKYDAVSSVKNQGFCGSCWAFATAGVLEAKWRQKNKINGSLSPQQLVDCSSYDYGCDGGDISSGLSYAKNGIVRDTIYPYYGYKKRCNFNGQNASFNARKYNRIYSESDLKYVLATQGPVSITMYASLNGFRYYSKGIYDEPGCYKNNQKNHAMLAVGYGTENGLDYWIIKNSWGTNWGENGYIRVRKGRRTCGIGDYSAYPIDN